MNAISEITSALLAQSGVLNYRNAQNVTTSETPGTQGSNSFLSILNLLDVNADGKTDIDELKFGAGFMINSVLYSKDQNDDLLLSAEELGVSPSLVSLLDTNSDGQLSNGEVITPANKIIDGLVPILDTNGDSALSRDELAIFELLFSSAPSEAGNQESEYASVEEALDLDTIPERMRQAGFQGRDNMLYYVLASTYAGVPWQPDPADPESIPLSEQREEIYAWFDNIVQDVANKMEANPNLTVSSIINDAPDRCGFRLGPAIMARLQQFGNRVQLGTVIPESEY